MNKDEAIAIANRISQLWKTINQEQLDSTVEIILDPAIDYARVDATIAEVWAIDSKFFSLSKLCELSGIQIRTASQRMSSWIDQERMRRLSETREMIRNCQAERERTERLVASITDDEWKSLAEELAPTLPEIDRRKLAGGKHPKEILLLRFAAADRAKGAKR